MSVSNTRNKILISSICLMCLLSLLFMTPALSATAKQAHRKAKKKGVVHAMTVLMISPPSNEETSIGVIFQVSQRRYKLPKDANPAYLKLLKESQANHTPVLVERASEASDVIVSVHKDPSGGKVK